MLDHRRMSGNDDELKNAIAFLARRKADRFGGADLRMALAHDLGPAGNHARLDEAEAAEGRAPYFGHQVGNGTRRAATRTLVAFERGHLPPRFARLFAAIPFHCARCNAIAAAWRYEERTVGNDCVSTCRSRGSP